MRVESFESLPVVEKSGLLLVGDPHVADVPPGQRLPGYREQILDKLRHCLDHAREQGLEPVFLGDLFNWPRDNSNALIVELIELFRPWRPWVLVGNHDKYQARYTDDVSMAVLDAAGAVRLMVEPSPQFILRTGNGDALVVSVPDGHRLPRSIELPPEPTGADECEQPLQQTGDTAARAPRPTAVQDVIVLTHHNIRFPEFPDRAYSIKEMPGATWVINGHIHRPQATVKKGVTTWANPGNITRLTFSRRSYERIPAAAIWKPGMDDLEKWVVPHLDFYEVFPEQDFPPEEDAPQEGESRFLQGLERLAWRRTREGAGLKRFLTDNLGPDDPESELIWTLYEEAVSHDDA